MHLNIKLDMLYKQIIYYFFHKTFVKDMLLPQQALF